MLEKSKSLAVLIDADNTSHNLIGAILEEIAKYGTACVKYIYGDWSQAALKSWKDKCLGYGLIAVQQFTYTAQKNSTDIAMVIDAMDLLHSETFDGFCLVSSDSDFTGLAARIRRNGLTVYGFGKENTPEAFRKACDKFIYTNNLLIEAQEVSITTVSSTERKKNSDLLYMEMLNLENFKQQDDLIPVSSQKLRQDTKLVNLFRNAIKAHEDESGWVSLGVVGNYINKIQPEFDYRSYGFNKLSSLVKAIGLFQHATIGSLLMISDSRSAVNYQNGIDSNIKSKLLQAVDINESPQYDGWAYLGDIGHTLNGQGIDYKQLGFATLSKLIMEIDGIEVKDIGSQKFVRLLK